MHDFFGHALATDKSGPHEMPGISPIDSGTRRAAGFTAAATRLQDHAIGQLTGGEHQSPSASIVGNDDASKSHRVPAPSASLALGGERLELSLAEASADGSEHLVVGHVEVGWIHGLHHGPPAPSCQASVQVRMGKQRIPALSNGDQR
jgi:hypothetical protein